MSIAPNPMSYNKWVRKYYNYKSHMQNSTQHYDNKNYYKILIHKT